MIFGLGVGKITGSGSDGVEMMSVYPVKRKYSPLAVPCRGIGPGWPHLPILLFRVEIQMFPRNVHISQCCLKLNRTNKHVDRVYRLPDLGFHQGHNLIFLPSHRSIDFALESSLLPLNGDTMMGMGPRGALTSL